MVDTSLALPCDCLELCVELNAGLSVEVDVSSDGGTRTSEREHGERDWDWNVDSDLSDVDFVCELQNGIIR